MISSSRCSSGRSSSRQSCSSCGSKHSSGCFICISSSSDIKPHFSPLPLLPNTQERCIFHLSPDHPPQLLRRGACGLAAGRLDALCGWCDLRGCICLGSGRLWTAGAIGGGEGRLKFRHSGKRDSPPQALQVSDE